MALTSCPECGHRVSDKAFACPSCGYPLAGAAQGRDGWPQVIGGVAGTWISSRALVAIILGVVMFVSFAAIMIALVVKT